MKKYLIGFLIGVLASMAALFLRSIFEATINFPGQAIFSYLGTSILGCILASKLFKTDLKYWGSVLISCFVSFGVAIFNYTFWFLYNPTFDPSVAIPANITIFLIVGLVGLLVARTYRNKKFKSKEVLDA